MSIIETLKNNRPELSKQSINTYESILRNLSNKLFNNENVENFHKTTKILKYLKTIANSTRKTILSALYVITENEKYKKYMLEDIVEYNKEIDKQEKTETQKNNWITETEINDKLEKLKKEADIAYKSDDKQKIQQYIILCLLSGKYIPPRRSLDYTEFKIKNITNNDNFIKGNKFYFNKYKGSDKKGQQVVLIPSELKKILSKWIKFNKTDYLLFDSKNNKLSSVKLNQRLNLIFGKKISINALRHSYLTENYKENQEQFEKLNNTMKMMGSSILQTKTYIKN